MTNLISEPYRELNRRLHERNPLYGVSAQHHIPGIRRLIESRKIGTVLDYGCGKGKLKQKLGAMVREYDPAIPGKDDKPEPADLVCCIDVMEHIEPEFLNNVLSDIRRCTKRLAFITVTCIPALKHLDDGRNAHLIVESPNWWVRKIMSGGFNIDYLERFDRKDMEGFLSVWR